MRFHADLSIPASQAVNPAGTLLFAPLASGWMVTHVRIGTDTAMRIIVAIEDAPGQRIAGGSFAAAGGEASSVCVPGFGPIYVFASAQGLVDVQIDGILTG